MHPIKSILWKGQPVYYLEQAGRDGHSPLLLLLHGFPGDAHDWTGQWEAFGHLHRVAPYLPGILDPVKPGADRFELEALADAIVAVLHTIDPERTRDLYIAGHDLGCFLIEFVRERWAGTVRGIIHINGMSLPQYAYRLRSWRTWLKSSYVLLLQFALLRKLLSETFGDFFLKPIFQRCGLPTDDTKFGHGKSVLGSVYLYRVLFRRACALLGKQTIKSSVPTLFLWGNRDAFLDVPRRSEVARFCDRGEIRVVQGGHWVNRSQREQVNRILSNAFADWQRQVEKSITSEGKQSHVGI